MDRNNVLLLVAAALLLGGGGYGVYTMTRGLRNNNPGNIIDDGTDWEGLDTPRNDGQFLRFLTPEYGFRAMRIIVNNYVSKDGVPSTVAGIISRWSATDQAAYVANVSSELGVDPNAPIDLTSSMLGLARGITRQENGLNPYSDQTIINGLNLA